MATIADDVRLLLDTYLKTDKAEHMDRGKERDALEKQLREATPNTVHAIARLAVGMLDDLRRNAEANENIANCLANLVEMYRRRG